MQLIHVSGGDVHFQHSLRNLAYGALARFPIRAFRHPHRIDQAAVAAFEGTYRFASFELTRHAKAPEFGGLGIDVAIKYGVLNVASLLAEHARRQGWRLER